MELLLASFVAGALTIAAPCILPLLPVIIGGTAARNDGGSKWKSPLTIAASLAVSITIFTLILKGTTALLGIPQSFWSIVAGGIVILFGINLLFPSLWEAFMLKTGLRSQSNALLGKTSQQKGWKGDVLMGAALGPVFSSCSPTYALIVATVLPRSFAEGVIYIIAYSIGLALALLLVALLGQSLVQKLGWLVDPHGLFRRVVGVLFIIVGIVVLFGFDKDIQTYVLENGWYDPIIRIEQSFQ